MGAIRAVKEEHIDKADDKNYFTNQESHLLESLNSLPFQIEFPLPVVKITCGDGFSSLLTSSGNVHTWGSNRFNQLGIDSS